MDDPKNWPKCLVCGKRTRFNYLKAQLCGSCSAEFSGLLNEEIQRYHDDLLEEWYKDLKNQYGTEFAAERFSKIMQYFVDWKNLYEKSKKIKLLVDLDRFYNGNEAIQEIDYDSCLKYLKQSVLSV